MGDYHRDTEAQRWEENEIEVVTWFGMVVFRESGSSIQDVVRDVAGEEAVGFGFVGSRQVAEVIFFEDSD